MALAKPMHRSGQKKTSTQTCNSVSHVLINLADVQMSQCFTKYVPPTLCDQFRNKANAQNLRCN